MDSRLIFLPFDIFSAKWRNLVVYKDKWISLIGEHITQKSFKEPKILKPYRKPTQVDECKCIQANKWKLLKELGKKVVVTSE